MTDTVSEAVTAPPTPSKLPPPLERGDPAPWFTAPVLSGSPHYRFHTIAGRHVLMLFFGSAARDLCARALALVTAGRAMFDDDRACFFGVTCDPTDATAGRIAQQLPGVRYTLDYDGAVSRAFRALHGDHYRPQWLLLDPALRVLASFPIDRGEAALDALRTAIAVPPADGWAPILVIPDVFPPELCEVLIQGYETNGSEPSGFMREIDGKTRLVVDPGHKQRRDSAIDDVSLRQLLLRLIDSRTTIPIERAFQFRPTRIERYIVACYEAGAGHFRPHRDNTTSGTAHRRFAMTINLNAGDYDGGDLRFPEFGSRTYRAPTGGAIVFSCSLLHEATPVTRGRRFAFLPFLYDEAAARIREANNANLGKEVGAYTA